MVPAGIEKKMVKCSRVLVCGYKGTGKTALLEQMLYKNVTREKKFHSTIEDTYTINIVTDKGTQESIRFYDIGGFTDRGQEIPRHFLALMDGFVLIYAVNNQESYNIIDTLKKDIDKNKERKDAPVLLIGTKLDLVEERQVDYGQVKAWADRERIKFQEVSIFDTQTFNEPFIHFASKLSPLRQKVVSAKCQ